MLFSFKHVRTLQNSNKTLIKWFHSRSIRQSRIIGTGMTTLGRHNCPSSNLMSEALRKAIISANISIDDLDAIITVPSLSNRHFMEAHFLATNINLLPRYRSIILRTVDTGGAGPITALLQASNMIKFEHLDVVAIVAADCVLSMTGEDFIREADYTCQRSPTSVPLPSPVIPHGYDIYAQYQMKEYNVSREQYAMCSVLMSYYATLHPNSMLSLSNQSPYTLEEVLNSRPIAKVTNLLECARRADGGAAVIIASTEYQKGIEQEQNRNNTNVLLIGGGEASGPLYPPTDDIRDINEYNFSCDQASILAFREANVTSDDIDWFGMYDCFPVTLIRAIEAVGLCDTGKAGEYIESVYDKYIANGGKLDCHEFPINTHGGLLGFGAPWEVPAMYNIIEAVDQIMGVAGSERQINNCRRALVYGNGGIFSHSAVAILSKPIEL